jgi:GMP synthase (glutamine-hydrolysing)
LSPSEGPTLKKIISLQHERWEHPGTLSDVLKADGFQVDSVHVYEGAPLPHLKDFDGLLVMGGPMNVDETDRYPWLLPERRLLADAVRADTPTVGICLGAQLIARAAGAAVYPKRPKEIGIFQIALTEAGLADPLLGPMGSPIEVFQWHGDTFDLPEGAVLLAGSQRCAHQAFRMGSGIYALQFHLECTAGMVSEFCRQCRDELAELPPEDRFERADGRLTAALARQNELAAHFIRGWAKLIP